MTHNTMRHMIHLSLAAGALVLASAQPVLAQNVSISVNQPGVYGRVDIGQPPPQAAWVRPQPVIVQPGQYGAVQRQPIYLYVPPAHYNNWGRYCGRYNACAQPVVFVQDGWVRQRHDEYRHTRGGRGDRDGDGIRNRNDRDRDGDGVPNRRDARPNNPYQR